MFFVERSAALCSLVPPPEGPRWSVEHWGTDSVNCPACRKALDEAPVTEEEEG